MERRRFPRVDDQTLSLKVRLDDFDTMTHTLNISASGLYCKLSTEIPLMSRVKLMLMIPDPSREDKSLKTIEVDGVVVREHPVIINGQTKHYDAAIFFEDLSPKTKELISDYISKKRDRVG